MKASEAEELKDPKPAAEFAAAGLRAEPSHHHHGALSSVRKDRYRDHEIEIVTTYEIRVDGVPVSTHLTVNKEGKLHSHAMPNYLFASAVSLVRRLIDLYPHEFKSSGGGHGHGGHTHEHP